MANNNKEDIQNKHKLYEEPIADNKKRSRQGRPPKPDTKMRRSDKGKTWPQAYKNRQTTTTENNKKILVRVVVRVVILLIAVVRVVMPYNNGELQRYQNVKTRKMEKGVNRVQVRLSNHLIRAN